MSGPRLSGLTPFRAAPRRTPDPLEGLDHAMRDALEAGALSLVTLCADGFLRAQGAGLTIFSRDAVDALVAKGLLVAVDDTSVTATRDGQRLAKLSRRRRRRFADFMARQRRGAA